MRGSAGPGELRRTVSSWTSTTPVYAPLRTTLSSAIAVAVCLVLGSVALPGCAGRSEPGVVLPAARRASAPADRRGQDRGDVEIALGALTVGVAATLVVLGAFSFHRAQELEDYCGGTRLTTVGDPCTDLLGFKPVRGARISGALEFALAVPIAVGGALLLRKGIRLRRDWKKEQRGPSGLSLRPWLMGQPGQQGVGLDLGFRF